MSWVFYLEVWHSSEQSQVESILAYEQLPSLMVGFLDLPLCKRDLFEQTEMQLILDLIIMNCITSCHSIASYLGSAIVQTWDLHELLHLLRSNRSSTIVSPTYTTLSIVLLCCDVSEFRSITKTLNSIPSGMTAGFPVNSCNNITPNENTSLAALYDRDVAYTGSI